MISKEELIWIKNQRKTSLYYEEKEYFQYIFLKSISNYGERFVFKGGTCLRICYESERASEDLDFNTNLNIEATKKIVKKALDEFKLLNIENVLLEEKEFQGNIRFEIRFKGPLYEGSSKSTNTVKIDFNQNPTEFTKVKIIPKLFSDIVPFPLVVMDLKEIFSEKIRALASRSQARDLYDIWMLIQNKVEVNEKLIEKKLKEENVSLQNIIFPSKKEYENDLKNLLTFLPPYDQVTKEVQKEIEKIKIK